MTESLKRSRIRRAIRGWRLMRFRRREGETVIRPHILFETQDEDVLVSGLYVRGYTSQRGRNRWRQYAVHTLREVEVLDETFDSTAADYNPESAHYHKVLCALPAGV